MGIADLTVEVGVLDGIVRAEFTGPVSGDGWARVCHIAVSHPRYDRDLPAIWDFTHVTTFGSEIHYVQIQALTDRVAAMTGGHDPRNGLAIVAPTDVGYGIGRMFAGIAGSNFPMEVQVFRDNEAAEDWLQEKAENPGPCRRVGDRRRSGLVAEG